MIIDGKGVAEQIQEEIKQEIDRTGGRKPCLAVLLVGNNPASEIYVNRKTQACAAVGILSILQKLPADISEEDLVKSIEALNANSDVDGILLQLPLPSHLNPIPILHLIDPSKDVDGLHPINAGRLMIGDTTGFVPCTPLGIKVILERIGVNVAGKHVVIVGRSNLVGKPMAALLMQNAPGANATVTIVHSRSNNFKEICRSADVLIVAIGQPKFITAEMVKEGAVVIDVGINKIDSASTNGSQLVGDVDFKAVQHKTSFITPVPGGVGPMTIAMLLSNTLKSYKQRCQPQD